MNPAQAVEAAFLNQQVKLVWGEMYLDPCPRNPAGSIAEAWVILDKELDEWGGHFGTIIDGWECAFGEFGETPLRAAGSFSNNPCVAICKAFLEHWKEDLSHPSETEDEDDHQRVMYCTKCGSFQTIQHECLAVVVGEYCFAFESKIWGGE